MAKHLNQTLTPQDHLIERREGVVMMFGPIPMDVWGKQFKGFSKQAVMDMHLSTRMGATVVGGEPEALNRLRATLPPLYVPSPWRELIGDGACAWVESAHVGTSSSFLLHAFTQFNALEWLRRGDPRKLAQRSLPLDADDLGRCRRLLEAVPAFRLRLAEVIRCDSGWAPLIDCWDEVCAVMDRENPDWRDPLVKGSTPQTHALLQGMRSK